jgi:hypothetical protein
VFSVLSLLTSTDVNSFIANVCIGFTTLVLVVFGTMASYGVNTVLNKLKLSATWQQSHQFGRIIRSTSLTVVFGTIAGVICVVSVSLSTLFNVTAVNNPKWCVYRRYACLCSCNIWI